MMQETLVLLKKVKFGESDLILHALTSRGAKLHFIAKGALTSRRRFGGGILEPTHYLSVRYKEKSGREQELKVLEEATLIDDFAGLKDSYEKLETAFELLTFIAKVAQEGDEHSKGLFDLLGNTLKSLQTSQRIGLLRLAFDIKILAQQGVLAHDIPSLLKFRGPIAEHERIELSPDEFQSTRARVSYELKNYLENRF